MCPEGDITRPVSTSMSIWMSGVDRAMQHACWDTEVVNGLLGRCLVGAEHAGAPHPEAGDWSTPGRRHRNISTREVAQQEVVLCRHTALQAEEP